MKKSSTPTSMSEGEQLAAIYTRRDEVNRDRAQVAAAADIPPKVHDTPLIAGGKTSSPEVAKIASKWLRVTEADMVGAPIGKQALAEIKQLAASVLAQTE